MEKGQFQHIISTLTNFTIECQQITAKIYDEESFENLTIKESRDLITRSQHMQSNMDKLCHDELYHIIGMGDMTVQQRSKFWSLMNKWLSYRSYIKPIATIAISNTPVIPHEESSYRCSVLGINLKVKNKK